jgi:hypothetical protein
LRAAQIRLFRPVTVYLLRVESHIGKEKRREEVVKIAVCEAQVFESVAMENLCLCQPLETHSCGGDSNVGSDSQEGLRWECGDHFGRCRGLTAAGDGFAGEG